MNRWNVTYTKHIKQKRKVYQDGILMLSADKVALYDDCEKLIVSRFLKKDEVIECGGMLAFETHLVDIGDPEVSHTPSVDLNVPREDVKLKERAGAEGEKPVYLGKKKSTLHSLPLRNHANAVHGSIRDNKKTTIQTEAVQKHSDTVPINNREWNVLYATQITQKSKRYHDGILRLVRCGSHTNQVILLNEDGTVLGSKYLKSVECVETGRDYEFSNFLVQICEPRTLPVGNSHGGSLQQVAGRSTGMDKLISNQKVTSIKSTPNDIQNEHTGVDCGDLDGRFTNINTKSKHEWNALYTTQKTQKAKKYHDGILQLVNCGSHMKQVILLNEDGVVLSSKYLKSIECLKIGQMYEFPNYLVEICAQRTPAGGAGDTPKQPLEEVPESRSTGTGNFMNTSNDYSDKSLLKDIQKGHFEEAGGGVNRDNGRSPSLNNRPRRDASQILSSLKRPVHTPRPSEIILLDVEKNNKMQEVDVREPTKDNHTGISIVVDSGCQGNPPSHECSISSNQPSGEVTPDISPTKLDIEYAGMKNECPTSSIRGLEVSENNAYTSSKIVQTNSSENIFPCDSRSVASTSRDKIASPSSSLPEDHNSANKNRSLTDEIMALQQDWSALSYQVSAIGNMKSPISFVQNNKHADKRCETVHHSGASSPICVATDPRSENSDLQGISNTCLNADEFPTFDLGFE